MMITPDVNTGRMNQFLAGLSGMLADDEHAVLVMDNAGWHVARTLEVPANLTLWPLPPYSPELNSIEQLWHWLRSHHLSNRVYEDYDDLMRQTHRAWLTLDPATLRTVCACPWLKRAVQA